MSDFVSSVAVYGNKITTGKMAKLLITLGIGALGLGFAFKFIKRRRNYILSGRVLKLIIYPIKSLPGIEFDEIEITKLGAAKGKLIDRGWLLVSKDDVFITIRQEPSLVTLRTSFDGRYLTVLSPDDSLIIDTEEPPTSNLIHTKVWKGRIDGYECAPECNAFFQKFLRKEGIKLIRFDPTLKGRTIQIFRNNRYIDDETQIVYHDTGPYHVINENSVAALNTLLEEYQVTYKNFRPTILIEAEPYSEDKFEFAKIGSIEFTSQHKTLRCMVTTTDPETGVRFKEPLKTLKEFRMPEEHEKALGTSPKMGIFLKCDQYGVVRVGDPVYASYF